MAKIENFRTKKAFDPESRYQQGGEVDSTPENVGPLDGPEVVMQLHKLEDWFEQERSLQAENRYQMGLDADFYDGLQYSEDDAQELMDRGQAPLVYNEVKPTIDWVVGTERRTKFDFDVLPRKEEDVKLAPIKKDVLKYISDVNRIPFERSQAFKECCISGLSWMEDGIRGDDDEDPIFSQHESWRNVWYDSNSRKLDYSDARYVFRRRVLDLDVATAIFPDRKDKLEAAAVDNEQIISQFDDDFYMGAPLRQNLNGTTPITAFTRYGGIGSPRGTANRRQRVEIIEAWTRTPKKVQKIRGDVFNGEIYDPKNQNHVDAFGKETISLIDSLENVIEAFFFIKGSMLWAGESPYKHKRFSLTPMWCYRRGRDNAPYGAVRNIRDPQEDLNKRASKALFILSTNQVIAEEGAVDDWDELREEVARPDGLLIHKKGKTLEIRQDKQLAQEHLALMDRDAQAIRNSGGVTDENLGRDSNAQSGKAIIARQTQGGVVTAEIFDNYLLSFQLQGENLLSLAEQYITMPMVIRLTGDKKGALNWTKVNQPQPDGSYLNDITQTKADFVVDEMDYRETIRQAMMEQLLEMIAKMPPEIGIKLLDIAYEYSDFQGKDELVKRIRQINGQSGPDDQKTPEELQADQAAQAAQQEAQALQQRAAEANVKMLEAKVDQVIAQTNKTNADKILQMVTSMYESLQSAQIVQTVPGAAPVADAILQGAGYQDPSPAGENPNIPSGTGGGGNPPMPGPGPNLPARAPNDNTPVTDGGDTINLPPKPVKAGGAQHGIETVRNDGSQPPSIPQGA